jgi:hypothetical protein
LTSKLFWRALRLGTGLPIPPDQSMLKIFDKHVLQNIIAIPDNAPFYPVLFAKFGLKQTTAVVKNDKRTVGTSKYTLSKMLNLASTGLIYYSFRRISVVMFLLSGVIISLLLLLVQTSPSNTLIILLLSCELIMLLVYSLVAKSYFKQHNIHTSPWLPHNISAKLL